MAQFLTSLDIVDTGFISYTNRTNQLSATNRANSGSALRLKGVMIELGSSANLDDETFTGNFDDVEVATVSVNADTIQLTIWINSKNVDANNVWGIDDMAQIAQLRRLTKTRGFKAIYYPVLKTATTVRAQDEQLLTYIGTTDVAQPQGDIDLTLATAANTTNDGYDLTDINYLPVYFKSFKVVQDSKSSGMKITLMGTITG
jgi:hypothetical protein